MEVSPFELQHCPRHNWSTQDSEQLDKIYHSYDSGSNYFVANLEIHGRPESFSKDIHFPDFTK